MPGETMIRSPTLMQLRVKMRPKLGATTAAMPASFIAAAASSRLEPQPKLRPPTIMSPRRTLTANSASIPDMRWLAISPGSYVGRNHIFGKMRSVLTFSPKTQAEPEMCKAASLLLQEFAWGHDVPGDRGGRDGRR